MVAILQILSVNVQNVFNVSSQHALPVCISLQRFGIIVFYMGV